MHSLQENKWYALYVRAKSERMVTYGLGQLQINHFMPIYRMRSERNGVLMLLEKPLFPGYLFCKTDLERGPKLLRLRKETFRHRWPSRVVAHIRLIDRAST